MFGTAMSDVAYTTAVCILWDQRFFNNYALVMYTTPILLKGRQFC